MWSPRRLPRLPARRPFLAVVAAVAHVLAATGVPQPQVSPVTAKPSDAPFPCQSRPCGCRTSAQCWAGACCCFTMRQKMAWAAEHGVTPPDHAARLAAAEAPPATTTHECCSGRRAVPARPKHSCCQSEKAQATCAPKPARPADDKLPTGRPVSWVAGVFAQSCHGHGPAGASFEAPAAVPAPPTTVAAEPVVVETVALVDVRPHPVPRRPALPPPID